MDAPKVPQTSFIPKRSLGAEERPAGHRSNLLLVVAIIVLLVSLVYYGGAWFYRRILSDEISKECVTVESGDTRAERCGLRAAVESRKQDLDLQTILDLQGLANKLRIAGDLLAGHNTIIPVFRLLEQLTLPTVSYTRFAYSDKGINLDGQAASYEDIAVQTQVFSSDPYARGRIKSFLFSDLNLQDNGRVNFKLTLALEPALTLVANNPSS